MTTKKPAQQAQSEARLQGGWRLVGRGIWIATALFNLFLFIVNLLQPSLGRQTLICPLTFSADSCHFDQDPATMQALHEAQISLAAYTTYATVFGLVYALIFIGISVLLLWRISDKLIGLLASLALLFIGSQSLMGDPVNLPTVIRFIAELVETNGMMLCLGLFLASFPDGRFVPPLELVDWSDTLCTSTPF